LRRVFPDPLSDAHLLPASPKPVRSCPDPQTSRPSATPCLPLAVRTCTTSLHKETCSCCSSRFPSLQRLKNAIGISVLCCNHLPLPQVQSKCQQRPVSTNRRIARICSTQSMSPRTEPQQRDLDEFPRDRRVAESVKCQWICRFTDFSLANSDLSQSKCLTQAVFLQRSLARIVHYNTLGLKSQEIPAENSLRPMVKRP
jgi:hypothetical protein